MRALRWPDAFPAGDVALQKALGVTTARAASEASQAWRPWRSYAVLRAWHAPASTPATVTETAAAEFPLITTAGLAA
jgi:AraC family transcriptional regulator of adaptative response / DNA-3-methyladenine glycosylase II